jgi:stage II sporulation protein M
MKKKFKARKKEFNLLEEYRKSWKYVVESKKFIYVAIGIFFFFALMGYFIPVPEIIYKEITELIKEIIEKTQNLSQVGLIKFIILNNLQSTLFGILFGIVFGIFPILSAIGNGYILGFVASISVESGGISTLWKILPHGVFELPAIFISLGLGIKLGTFIFRKKKSESLRNLLVNSLRVFLLIIVPLLITAGIIEGTLIFLLAN